MSISSDDDSDSTESDGEYDSELDPDVDMRMEDDVISKMYFSLWKTPGVSERMWSVNLEPSISGEYQTLGGYSGRPSE